MTAEKKEPETPPGGDEGPVSGEQRKAMMEHLLWLNSEILPLLRQAHEQQKALDATKEKGRSLVRQAYGVLLMLGKTEKQAEEEIAKWRRSTQ